jgi:hypothetical protein
LVIHLLFFEAMARLQPPDFDFEQVPWEAFFRSQIGSGASDATPQILERLHARPHQRGRGFAAVLSAIGHLVPAFLSSSVGKELVEAGKNVAADVAKGEKVARALKTQSRASVRRMTGLGKADRSTTRLTRTTNGRRKRLGPTHRRKFTLFSSV